MGNRIMKNSGIEWVGEIPSSWEVHPVYHYFGERKVKNSTLSEQNLLSLSYGNIIRKDINTNGGLLPASFNTYNIVEPGDIIIRPTDLQNDKRSLRTGLVTEKGIITSAYIDLKPMGNVNSKYFHYLLHSYDTKKVFYNMGNGVRQGLNYSEFSKLMVFAPSQEEQALIVNFLDKKCSEIDSLSTDIQKQIETLEEYKKSVITEAVTKGLDPDIDVKDSGIEWIGAMPKHWTLSRLKYNLSEPMKYGASEAGVDYDENLPRYIRITDITPDNKLKENGKLSLTFAQANGYMLSNDTILFARSGGTVGKTFLYTSDYGLAAFAGYLISAIVDKTKMLPKWLWYFSLSNSYWEWANQIFTQATIQNIGADKYSNLPITTPSIKTQEEIVLYLDAKCSEIDKVITDKKAQLETLEQYKKSIIYEYVTGKKEVKETDYE